MRIYDPEMLKEQELYRHFGGDSMVWADQHKSDKWAINDHAWSEIEIEGVVFVLCSHDEVAVEPAQDGEKPDFYGVYVHYNGACGCMVGRQSVADFRLVEDARAFALCLKRAALGHRGTITINDYTKGGE